MWVQRRCNQVRDFLFSDLRKSELSTLDVQTHLQTKQVVNNKVKMTIKCVRHDSSKKNVNARKSYNKITLLFFGKYVLRFSWEAV